MPVSPVETTLARVFLVINALVAAFNLWQRRRWLLSLLDRLHACLRPRPREAEPPLARRVREECAKRQIERARWMLAMSVPFVAAGHLLYMVRLQRGELSVTATASSYAIRAVMLVLGLCPQAISPRTIDAFYSLAMAIMVAASLATSPEAVRLADQRFMFIIVFLWTIVNPRAWLNAVWLAALAAAQTARAPGSAFDICSGQCVIFFTAYGMNYIMSDYVCAKLLAAESNKQLTAVRTLLNSICDDVFEVDSGLRLRQHSPKLASILLHGPTSSLEGVALEELMPLEEDRGSFTRHMRQGDGAATHADVFHARLRDSDGTSVAMELFSVPFRDLEDRQGHIVGVREFTDTAPLAPPQREPPRTSAPLPRRVVQQIWHGTPASSEQGDVRSHSGSRSSGRRSERSGRRRSGGQRTPPPSSPPAVAPADARPVETSVAVKARLLVSTMKCWLSERLPGACCPLHAEVAEAQRVLRGIAAVPCDPHFGPETAWRCGRCSVAADIFRPRGPSRGCQVCEDMTSEGLGQPACGAYRMVPL